MVIQALTHRQPRKWTRVVLEADAVMGEAAAALLAELVDGVEVIPVASSPPGVRIIGYLPVAEGSALVEAPDILAPVRSLVARLSALFADLAPPVVFFDTIEEEDWGAKWKEHFTTFRITPRIVIKPSWEKLPPEGLSADGDLIIEMDPGLAFGTGHHASTQLALTLIDALFAEGASSLSRVLDVGTGTGVLAMGCALLGAREVVAIDNDPDAVVAARANIEHNKLQERITVSGVSVGSLDGIFDLVVANITSDVLLDLAPRLVSFLGPAGYLVLAGILRGEQEALVVSGYRALGLNHLESKTRDEWVALCFQKGAGCAVD